MSPREQHAPQVRPHSPAHVDHFALLETLLELDAQIHAALIDEALDAVANVARPAAVRRVLDVGAGTGAATFRLAARYPEADLVALDANAAMARRIAARAARSDVPRVRAVPRPLRMSSLEPGSVDLGWASSVAHEFEDPARELATLAGLLRPGAVLAIMETDAPPRVLPARYEAEESRLRRLAGADAPPLDWSERLGRAGFALVARHTLAGDRTPPADGPGGAYARAELRRLAHAAAGGLDTADRATFARILAAPGGSGGLREVRIRGTRSLWIARR